MRIFVIVLMMILSIGNNNIYAQSVYEMGSKVSNFSMKSVDGKTYSLSDYDNKKAVVVIFTTNHCPYAKLYEDRIIAIQSKYAGQGVQVIAINPNDASIMPEDSFEEMIKRSNEKGFNFPYLHDTEKVFADFGAKRTPEVFLLDSNDTIVYHGAIDDNARDEESVDDKYLENAIDALLSGKEINPKDTKAIGCSIKQ